MHVLPKKVAEIVHVGIHFYSILYNVQRCGGLDHHGGIEWEKGKVVYQAEPIMEPSAEEKQSSRLCHEDGDVEPCSYAMQLVTSSVLPMVMQTSIELGLFDIIAKLGQASASEIASRLPTRNPEAPIMLDRMLYLLTTHSVLSCSAIDGDERVYALTPVSKYFASNQGVSFGPLLALIQDKVFMDSWSVCSFSLSLALLSILLTIVPLLTPSQFS